MAKAIKHEATLPDGSIAKRSSQSRRYSHCVAFRRSYESALMAAKQLVKVDRSNFEYHVRESDPATARWCRDEDPEAYCAKHRAEIEGCASAGDYQKKLIAQRVAAVEEAKAAGRYEQWGVSGWCSRLDLAQKLAGAERAKGWVTETRIIEARIV